MKNYRLCLFLFLKNSFGKNRKNAPNEAYIGGLFMKSKSKKQQLRRKKEFRFHNIEIINQKGITVNSKHPTYVFLQKGNLYIAFPITHSDKIGDLKIVELSTNPNPMDSRKSYIVIEVIEDTKDRFGKKKKNWSISPEDDAILRNEYKK